MVPIFQINKNLPQIYFLLTFSWAGLIWKWHLWQAAPDSMNPSWFSRTFDSYHKHFYYSRNFIDARTPDSLVVCIVLNIPFILVERTTVLFLRSLTIFLRLKFLFNNSVDQSILILSTPIGMPFGRTVLLSFILGETYSTLVLDISLIIY